MIQLSNFHFGNRSTEGVNRRARLFLLALAVATVFFGTDRGTSGEAGTIITNSATVTSSTPDPDLSDNTATTTVVFPFQ